MLQYLSYEAVYGYMNIVAQQATIISKLRTNVDFLII